MTRRWMVRATQRALVITLGATVVAPLATSGAAGATGPSVELPVVKSVPVGRQVTTAHGTDEATRNALSGNKDPRADKEGEGSFKATSLSPSATWDVSEQSGDFVWSYPLRVPPVPGGLAPGLSLSYRSSAVDGHTSATNNQPSWVGDGWDLSVGFVERAYGGCAGDTDGGVTPPKTGDLCWRSDNATASFDAGGGMLIRDDGTGVWRTKSDNGVRVERLTGLGNGDDNGEYWKITTVDGTQYFFGSQPDAASTWTVPVFGDDVGEPCHGASFEASHCLQGWRWNLDKVIDRNGNMIRYFYEAEHNRYGRNLKDTAVEYVRGGVLRTVEYGLHERVAGPAVGRVVFGTADRCLPGSRCSVEQRGNWPDTPLDQRCVAQTCPKLYSPSFWSTRRLSTVTTQVRRGSGYADVDRWALEQQYPDPGDGEKPALWLKSIVHTGLVGGSIDLPAVTFEGTKMANRVYQTADGLAPLNRYRLTGVVTESGGWTSITYAPPECTPDTLPLKPESNIMRCFPVRWAKKDFAERTDHFHKYVVKQITQSDQLSTSTQQVTSYEYLDGAAWHWDMSEFAKDDKKTWNEFRGFGRVRTRVGASPDPAGPVTMVEQRYHRGMDGDRLRPDGGTRPVTLSDSEGGPRTDHDWLTGIAYETITFEREGPSSTPDPPAVGKTITDLHWSGPTARRGPFHAYLVRPAAQRQLTALRSGGWRTTKTETRYDREGFPVSINDFGDTATAADDRCTRTWYTRNTDRWILNLPSRAETVAVNCETTPKYPDQAVSDAQTFYDGNGNMVRTEVVKEHSAGAPVYVTTGTTRHDVHGRILEAADALGNVTRSAFVPPTGGPVTQTTTTTPPTATDPDGMVTTTEVEPASGQPTKVTDPNGRVTETAYDGLGRKVEVWLPNRPRGPNPSGSVRFTYTIRSDAPTVVTTTAIGPNGNFTSSNTLLDGFLRPRQVQAPAAGGGRLLTDTRYDSHGRAFNSTQPYFNDAPVDDQLWVAADTQIPGLTRTEFDGAGRAVAAVYQAGAGTPQEKVVRTTTSYDGDRVHVTPPAGGTATTTISDARGQTTELRQYHGPTPAGGYDSTRYAYTAGGQLAGMVSPGGATWRFAYDPRGRAFRTEDPDNGVKTMTYDDADRVVSTTDARGVTIAYAYDRLGRNTAVHRDSLSGPVLSTTEYDTAMLGKGQPASSTRFVDGHAYRSSVDAYTALYQPTEKSVTIPAVEGLLAGTYTWSGSYGRDGTLTGETYPEMGGLPKETIKYELDDWGRPKTTTAGANGRTVTLVGATSYTRYGEVERVELGSGTKRSWLSSYYDKNTRRLNRSIVDAEVPAPMQADVYYTQDDAGNVTSVADKVRDQVADVQCFRHDHVRRLTEAWTPDVARWSEKDGCSGSPAAGELRGPAPYWHSYGYDKDGNRRSETQRSATGDTTRTYDYPNPDQPRPHAVRSVTTTRPAAGGTTETFDYDAAGNTTGRTKAGVGQTLTWDPEGHLGTASTAGQTTSFVYTPDGARLLRKDPEATTLYLGSQEVRLAGAGGRPVATRYYSHGGQLVAQRTGATLTWLAGDHQGTAQIAVDSGTLAVTRRRQLPFGGPRGQEPVSWPNDHGFVGGVKDSSTGLTHLGAREYDPALGRFISVDPIMNVADPQQWNAYGYANNSPVTSSDPAGLIASGPDGECARFCAYKPGTNPHTNDKPRAAAPPPSSGGGRVKPKGTSMVALGNDAIAEARGRAADIAVIAKRNGFRTEIVMTDITVAIHNGSQGMGLPSEYTMVPGVVIALSFSPVVQCVDPVDPRVPVANPSPMTRAELEQWRAAQARLQAKPHAELFWEFIGEITGINSIVNCVDNPSVGRCMEAVSTAAGPVSRATKITSISGKGLRAGRELCSFTGGTRVLMADGTTKPIAEVREGDQVLAEDPETGERGPRTVTRVHVHRDTVVDLVTEDGAKVTTTEDHPFWNATDQAWERADQLDPGDALLTSTGSHTRIVGLLPATEYLQLAYNLTVDDLHTYHVALGDSAVLVHNDCTVGRIDPNTVRYSQATAKFKMSDGTMIDDLADGLRNGSIDPAGVPPIRLVNRGGHLYTLDHRRLIAFQTAGVNIPYRMATQAEIDELWHLRYDTPNDGTAIQLAMIGLTGKV